MKINGKDVVVVDCDDVLLLLNETVEQIVKLHGYLEYSIDNILTFDLNKSVNFDDLPPKLKDLEGNGLGCPRELLYQLYSEPESYLSGRWVYRVYECMKSLCKKYTVIIHTSCLNTEILCLKTKLFDEKFADLDLSYSFFVGHGKPALTGAYAVIDDCIDNLSAYPDDCVKYLVDRPWNRELFNSKSLLEVESLVRVQNFCEAVEDLLI